MSDKRYRTTDLTPADQERLQAIIDDAALTGVKLDFPKAIRVALTAWEQIRMPRRNSNVSRISQDPEALERWRDREIDKQLNPLEES